MKMVGGSRHADDVELPEGAKAHLDLRTADTWYVRGVQYLERDPATQEPSRYYKAQVLVWEKLLGQPQEGQLVMAMVMDLAARSWFAEHGEEAEMPGHLRAQQNGANSAKLITPTAEGQHDGSDGSSTAPG